METVAVSSTESSGKKCGNQDGSMDTPAVRHSHPMRGSFKSFAPCHFASVVSGVFATSSFAISGGNSPKAPLIFLRTLCSCSADILFLAPSYQQTLISRRQCNSMQSRIIPRIRSAISGSYSNRLVCSFCLYPPAHLQVCLFQFKRKTFHHKGISHAIIDKEVPFQLLNKRRLHLVRKIHIGLTPGK